METRKVYNGNFFLQIAGGNLILKLALVTFYPFASVQVKVVLAGSVGHDMSIID